METKEDAADLCCWQLGRTSLADRSELPPAATFMDDEQQCRMVKCWLWAVPFPVHSRCPLHYNFRLNDSRSWELLLTHGAHCKSNNHHQKGQSLKFRGERQHTIEFLIISGGTERWFSNKHIFGQSKIFWTVLFSLSRIVALMGPWKTSSRVCSGALEMGAGEGYFCNSSSWFMSK